MSKYQYVAFRAIDAPVSEKNLEFMRRQSSRAEITSWSFKNEYHFGDFRGNAAEMLRRGYDFHFHYANYGVRKLMIRVPSGLPDAKAADPYFEKDSLHFLKDKQGCGGIFCVEPYIEAGELDDLWDLDDTLDDLLPLRAEILDGDLRPLYLAHLAVASDGNHDHDEKMDVPVPAGLDKLTKAQRSLAKLYGLSDALISAAARNSPPLPVRSKSAPAYAAWLQTQPDAIKTEWLGKWMADPHTAVRVEILAEYQKSCTLPAWPTIRVNRSVAELRAECEGIQLENDRRDMEAAARKRAKELADMAAHPTRILAETEKLVADRNLYSYEKIARLLADLREALSGTDQSMLAEQHARKLKEKNPTLHLLTSRLRAKDFLKK